MGGSSKSVTVGYKYYVGMHMVFCHGPVDSFTKIKVDDRGAWAGTVSGQTSIAILQPELFGGESREGGVSGDVDILCGHSTQTKNDYLVSKLGSLVPAFRGVASIVLRQVYVGLNPYLKKWSARIQRIHVRQNGIAQWYDEKAEIKNYKELIGAGNLNWRYKVVALTDASDYSSADYDDTSWPVGPSPIADKSWPSNDSGSPSYYGFASDPGTTVPQQRKVWLRTEINLTSVGSSFFFDSFVDNGIEVWVNGQKVVTNYETYGHYFGVNIPGSYFVVGQNEIAVLGRDDSLGERPNNWFYFDLRLRDTSATISDMNPAHIIRECLTDPLWGMGYQDSDIDDDSFIYAANRLYSEGMGMSILWDTQTSIEEFVKIVIQHIDAALFVDRQTGKFVLKLIRDDYTEGDLILLNESNIDKVADFTRPAFGELTNSVTVTFWNAELEETSSVTVQDIALAQEQGATINTTVTYEGFTNPSLVSRVAQRDLKTLSTPLISCTIYANRDAANLNIGDVFKFSWADYEVSEMVMRVTGIAYGDGKSNRIRIQCAQDVFALPDVSFVPSTPPVWEDPSGTPIAVSKRILFEVPYLELVQIMGQRDVDSALDSSPEIGYVGVAAARPQSAAINAVLYTDSGAGYKEATRVDFCPFATLSEDVSETTTVFNVEDANELGSVTMGTWAQIGTEIVAIVAIAGAAVTVERGLLDTVPVKHTAGQTLYFWDNYCDVDSTEYVTSDSINGKLLTVTGGGQLALSSAPADNVGIVGRAARPYPPGNFKINGEYFPASVIASTFDFTWSHRDRKQQTGSDYISFTDGSVGPETGTTYNLRLYDESDVLLSNNTGITGTSLSVANPAPAGGTEFAPTSLNFSKVCDVDYSVKLPASLIDHSETFSSDTGQFSHYDYGNPGTYGIVSGQYAISQNSASDAQDIVGINTVSYSMPVIWTEVELSSTGSPTGYNNGGVGIVKDASNFLYAVAQRTQNAIRIEIRIAGTTTFLANVAYTVPSSFKLGLALVANSATVYIDSGSGWQYVTGLNVGSYYDFRTIGNLTGWKPGVFLASKGGATTWNFDNLKTGRFGGVGMRDQTLVTNEDGSPYHPTATTVLFTATLPDRFGASYAGVFSLDLTNYAINQVGAIMVERDGKVHADLVPHIIYYANGNRRITIGTWGNGLGNSIQVLHKLETSQELLSGTHVVSGMTQLSLPGQTGANPGAYDPMLVYDSANSRWLIAYSLTDNTNFSGNPFYAAAAYSSDLSTWTLIGKDSAHNGYEGTKIVKTNADYWILAGGPAGSGNSSRVYDASMVYQGALNAVFEGGTSTQPHPMVFPYGDKQLILTFDDTRDGSASFTWGNFLIYEASRYAPATSNYRVELESLRDGLTSFQKYDFTFESGV